MKVTTEINIRDFQFWSGGADRAKDVRYEDWDDIENAVEDLFPDGCTDTELNDLFWFDFDIIARTCGYESEEHYFYGAAKDEDAMAEKLAELFPEASEEAIEEWCEWEWCKTDVLYKCCELFKIWYRQNYATDIESWIDMVFEKAEGTIEDMRTWAKANVENWNEKSAEDWLNDYNEWFLDEKEKDRQLAQEEIEKQNLDSDAL